MKINWKSISITGVLLIVLCLVVLIEISLFISGPARKYEHDVEKQMQTIQTKYQDIQQLQRHVFYYTTYVGQDDKTVVWFNELGKVIVSRKKSTLDLAAAKQKAEEVYGIVNASVTLGYGYDNPVYVIVGKEGSVLLDYDTLKEVYFLKEGDI